MKWLASCGILILFAGYGCTPMVAGGAAVGVYKGGTEERTMGRVIDDSNITSRVNMAFIEDPQVSTLRIDVDTINGEVTLTGVVASRSEADKAVEISRTVNGVKSVVDALQVGSKGMGQTFDDKVLGTKVKTKLIMEPGIRSLNIDVDVNNSEVVLTGIVDTKLNRNKIIEIARTTNGTAKVIDNLKVSE